MRPVFVRRRSNTRAGRLSGWRLWPALALGAVAMPLSGCTSAQLQGQASSYVIMQALEAASGAAPNQFGGTLASDVQTVVEGSPTIFEDPARVQLVLAMKNPVGEPPTTANYVTFTRYRVTFQRADGRNTPGVDVPYPFDGAITVTVGDAPVSAGLTLVRVQAKKENPLLPLVGGGGALAISTIAEVTLYGADQAGREVTVSGKISVTFADWGDPS